MITERLPKYSRILGKYKLLHCIELNMIKISNSYNYKVHYNYLVMPQKNPDYLP